jgi:CheY-like chemotaxis protein
MSSEPGVILVVEDEPTDLLLLQRAFTRTGTRSQIRSVPDGDLAVAYLAGEGVYADRERHPLPNLMLLDLKLPRRSGFEVLDWVRHNDRLGSLPTIMLTSSRERVDVDKAYALGANSYFAKPGSFDELVELVQAFERYWLQLSELPQLAPGA